jgi:hypothetical protein
MIRGVIQFMLETKIFTESPFKILKKIGIILGSCALFYIFVSFSNGMPQITDQGLNKPALMISVTLALFSGLMLIAFLACSFQRKKTLRCDFNGCEVLEAKFCFWQSTRPFGEFKWSEITDTNVVEKIGEYYDDGILRTAKYYTFAVQTKDGAIDLMELNTSDKKNIEGLINYVNRAAAQTKYIWVKNLEMGNCVAIGSNYGYSKIERTN